jgi:7-carboxy-7-deazaguanine synthase
MNDARKPGQMKLPLVEEFYTLQGEGYHAGRAAYFIRLGGCDIGCNWCDSRFAWNEEMHPLVHPDEIIRHVADSGTDSVVVTGGEPLMWNLDYLCEGLKKINLSTFIETSGAYPLTGRWDWICLSPKRNAPPREEIFSKANELKVIIQTPDDLEWAEINRKNADPLCKLFLQPEWSRFEQIIPVVVQFVKNNPAWRVSLQIHKYMHIP